MGSSLVPRVTSSRAVGRSVVLSESHCPCLQAGLGKMVRQDKGMHTHAPQLGADGDTLVVVAPAAAVGKVGVGSGKGINGFPMKHMPSILALVRHSEMFCKDAQKEGRREESL